MSLGASLAVVLGAFLAILASVVALSFRERRLARTLHASDTAAQGASDERVLFTIFGAILGGMALTLVTASLLFL